MQKLTLLSLVALALGSANLAQASEQICGKITVQKGELFLQDKANITQLEISNYDLKMALRAYVNTKLEACVTGAYAQYKFFVDDLVRNAQPAPAPQVDSGTGGVYCLPPGSGYGIEWECDDGSW